MLVKTQRPNHLKILEVATKIAIERGLNKTYVSTIAKEMNSHHSLLYTYYESMEMLRDKVIQKAIDEGIIEIIIDALLSRKITKIQLSEDIMEKISSQFSM